MSRMSLFSSLVHFATLLIAAWSVSDGAGHIGVKCVEKYMAAKVGEDLLVSCHCSFPDEATEITNFSWTKLGTMGVIYNYSISQMQQDTSYRHRAEVFASEVHKGNVSLRLRNVTLLDSGIYRLIVSSASQGYETHVVLGVRANGEQPVIRSHVSNQGLPVLVCESSGWFPEPSVTWESGLGTKLTKFARTENVDNIDGSIHMKSVLDLGHRFIGNFTCTIRAKHLNKSVSSVFVVPFPGSAWHIAAGAVGMFVCSVILTVAIYWSW
ncbi:butyrophilin-like protein 8 isoform X2 [Narcine bancroftii]